MLRFCYINDIVLGITTIRKMFSGNVFYLDLDLHNGDGVAEAFKYSKKVATCSVHRCEVGFFQQGQESWRILSQGCIIYLQSEV